jgi:hypothetical protein
VVRIGYYEWRSGEGNMYREREERERQAKESLGRRR